MGMKAITCWTRGTIGQIIKNAREILNTILVQMFTKCLWKNSGWVGHSLTATIRTKGNDYGLLVSSGYSQGV